MQLFNTDAALAAVRDSLAIKYKIPSEEEERCDCIRPNPHCRSCLEFAVKYGAPKED